MVFKTEWNEFSLHSSGESNPSFTDSGEYLFSLVGRDRYPFLSIGLYLNSYPALRHFAERTN
jgi:hypothetical protein